MIVGKPPRRYEGQWIAGKPVGEGIKTYEDGTSRRGMWEEGVFTVIEEVDEADLNKNEDEGKPIDLTKIAGLSEGQLEAENMSQLDNLNASSVKPPKESSMMKIFVDNEGFVMFPDGSRYKGSLQNGIPNGEGTIIYTDGSEYSGEWRAGNSHGQGTLKFPDGSVYEGNWSKGKYHGKGAYVTKMNAKYDGDW